VGNEDIKSVRFLNIFLTEKGWEKIQVGSDPRYIVMGQVDLSIFSFIPAALAALLA